MSVAAVDLGTNSIRLLAVGDDGSTLVRSADVTGLGRGLHRTGRLSPEGVAATLDLLRAHRRRLDELGVTRVRAVATAAARRASDAAGFLADAGAAIGVPVEVISGDEEARLSFAGATADLPPGDGTVLVIDIGGGSTELAAGRVAAPGHGVADGADGPAAGPEGTAMRRAAVTASWSVDLGCVTLTDAELAADPPRPEELTNAIGAAADAFAEVWLQRPELRHADRLVGVGGTITTLGAVELGLPTYDRAQVHGLELDRSVVEEVFRTLATEALADRVHNPGLKADRAPVIVGGLCVLVALMRTAPAASLRIADADLLDAMVAELRG